MPPERHTTFDSQYRGARRMSLDRRASRSTHFSVTNGQATTKTATPTGALGTYRSPQSGLTRTPETSEHATPASDRTPSRNTRIPLTDTAETTKPATPPSDARPTSCRDRLNALAHILSDPDYLPGDLQEDGFPEPEAITNEHVFFRGRCAAYCRSILGNLATALVGERSVTLVQALGGLLSTMRSMRRGAMEAVGVPQRLWPDVGRWADDLLRYLECGKEGEVGDHAEARAGEDVVPGAALMSEENC